MVHPGFIPGLRDRRKVGFGWPATKGAPEQPRGHFEREGRVVEQPLDDSYVLPVVLWPAGAVNISMNDLARYAADHLDGLRGRPALLPSAAYERLHRTLTGETEGFTLGEAAAATREVVDMVLNR